MREETLNKRTSQLAKELGANVTTPSSLQKWLRQYKFFVCVLPYDDSEGNQILYENKIINIGNECWGEKILDFSDYTFYHTYEEALDGGLYLALETFKKLKKQ